jgi:hypothetical protein
MFNVQDRSASCVALLAMHSVSSTLVSHGVLVIIADGGLLSCCSCVQTCRPGIPVRTFIGGCVCGGCYKWILSPLNVLSTQDNAA